MKLIKEEILEGMKMKTTKKNEMKKNVKMSNFSYKK